MPWGIEYMSNMVLENYIIDRRKQLMVVGRQRKIIKEQFRLANNEKIKRNKERDKK